MEYAFASGGRSAHPRSRGENGRTSRPSFPVAGSSPLTRGKRRRCPECDRRAGLIPAHAGKTCRLVRGVREHEAHPRSRGENGWYPSKRYWYRGSSPLTRGKHRLPCRSSSGRRLIPAHAGKTVRALVQSGHDVAHPRSRGENDSAARTPRGCSGSSPLTRGKQTVGCPRQHRVRLIPAHAGKTAARLARMACSAAHPRSRGENTGSWDPQRSTRGSSPLTRGKHFLTCAFTAQIDQILETLELAASFGSYLIWVACATDAPQDPVRSIGLVLPSSMGAS